MSESLPIALVELRLDDVLDEVKSRVRRGEDALQVLEDCRRGMTIVGDRFQKGEYFLAELMLSAEIFKKAVTILDPHLDKARSSKPTGKVVLATLKGDVHDLGKNILVTLFKAQGFEVYDLGVDVEPAVIVEKVKEVRPDFVGFSTLITTAFGHMKEAAEMLQEAGLRAHLKLLIGGAVTTPMVKDYVGADFQTLDAVEGLRYCVAVIEGK